MLCILFTYLNKRTLLPPQAYSSIPNPMLTCTAYPGAYAAFVSPLWEQTARPNALLQSPLSFNRGGGGEDGSAIGSLRALLSLSPLAECMQLFACVRLPLLLSHRPPPPTCKFLGWLLMLCILEVLRVEVSRLWFLRLGGPPREKNGP